MKFTIHYSLIHYCTTESAKVIHFFISSITMTLVGHIRNSIDPKSLITDVLPLHQFLE